MKIKLRYETTGVDWEEVAQVIKQAPLGIRDPEKFRQACEKSYIQVVFAYEQETLIGLGRALCDGEYQAVIYDVVVLPQYQGRGVGKLIMESIIDKLPVTSIILFAVPGKETFYELFGFKRLKTGMGKFENTVMLKANGYIE